MLFDFSTFVFMKVTQYALMVFLFTFISLREVSSSTIRETKVYRENNASLPEEDKEQHVIDFARKLLGVKYTYGATSPSQGFDCSGFVYYVFKKFAVTLPRSSSAIGQAGKSVSLATAKAGDIILFTGTNPAKRVIGHVGIVLSNDAKKGLSFIHASSGKAQAVTETMLEGSYKRRFMKIIRVI